MDRAFRANPGAAAHKNASPAVGGG